MDKHIEECFKDIQEYILSLEEQAYEKGYKHAVQEASKQNNLSFRGKAANLTEG